MQTIDETIFHHTGNWIYAVQAVSFVKRLCTAVQCLPNPSQHWACVFNSFRVIRCLSQCVSPQIAIFTYRSPHFSPGDAPAIIKQYVAWMERQFNACQTYRSMYLSIFNSFRVIRCLSQCVTPNIAIFTTFLFPLGTPWGNHAKCCMDGKGIRCLQIVSLHVPI